MAKRGLVGRQTDGSERVGGHENWRMAKESTINVRSTSVRSSLPSVLTVEELRFPVEELLANTWNELPGPPESPGEVQSCSIPVPYTHRWRRQALFLPRYPRPLANSSEKVYP